MLVVAHCLSPLHSHMPLEEVARQFFRAGHSAGKLRAEGRGGLCSENRHPRHKDKL